MHSAIHHYDRSHDIDTSADHDHTPGWRHDHDPREHNINDSADNNDDKPTRDHYHHINASLIYGTALYYHIKHKHNDYGTPNDYHNTINDLIGRIHDDIRYTTYA